MTKTKRLLAALLASCMILPCVACATDSGLEQETKASVTTGAGESDTAFFPDIEKQDYQGATFCMFGASGDGSWYLADEYKTGGENIHVLNNTLFEMNTLIEEYLNVELLNGNTAGVPVDTTIMSGDDVYQAVLKHAYWDVAPYVANNYVLDMNELEYIDFSQPYWNGPIIEELSIADHAFVAVGDICWSVLYMIYTNKDLMGQANIKMPYDKVRNGSWTFDELIAMTTNLYIDDGDGQRNSNDTYGFAACLADWSCAIPHAAGISIASKNDTGGFDLTFYNERTVELYDTFYTWSQDDSVKVWCAGATDGVDFAAGKTYVTGTSLGTQYLSLDFEVGILPMPKYDAAQESYAHVNWGHELMVPSTVKDRDMVGQVLELMAFYSGTMVREKYYNEVLQLRVSEAPDDRDMVELIYNTVVYDPGMVYAHAGGSNTGSLYPLCYTFHSCFGEGKNITSYCKSYLKPAQKQLDNLIKKVMQRG